ncbi:MAG: Gfo/Idh/MocA family oxidoreductase [Isosphaeraceae bacterium]|nr:Gfo/Idh/MocA family oxidoreductase [Isosphaeraceae bacterium]
MIDTIVVGMGLAGRSFHLPLIRLEPRLRLSAIVSRDPARRDEASNFERVPGFASLEEVLDSGISCDLVVLATPHHTHADLAVAALNAGKHCVTDKVMCLTEADSDRMIDARDRSGKMLSVFHNRRWDWDWLTLRSVLDSGSIGDPIRIESSVVRYSAPRTWRGRTSEAGTILHDWGAHLVDQALMLGRGPCRRLRCRIAPAPWDGVDSGGHGRIELEFDGFEFGIETSRICALDRPRWWVLASRGGYLRIGVDPQEEAVRSGDITRAADRPEHGTFATRMSEGRPILEPIDPVRGSWTSYYAGIADHLIEGRSLEVTAEQAREVVRLLAAAERSAQNGSVEEGPWGDLPRLPVERSSF